MSKTTLIDESTSLGKQALMVIYIRSRIIDTDPTTFLDIVAPLYTNTNWTYTAFIYSCSFTDQYMSEHLVCIWTDGASVMLRKHAGVQTLIKNTFPNIVGWHCLTHRLELSVRDATKSCTEKNHFLIFFNKLYCIYSQSSKNVRELPSCALELESGVRKIWRLLDTRWIASSFRTAMAVWTSYGALQKHFQLSFQIGIAIQRKEQLLQDYIRNSLLQHCKQSRHNAGCSWRTKRFIRSTAV